MPKGVAGAVICCAIWGGNAVAAKYCIADGALPPIGGAALRFAISLPVVALVCVQGKRRSGPALETWWLCDPPRGDGGLAVRHVQLGGEP